MNWWEKNPVRLETEKALMGDKFPQFTLARATTDYRTNGWLIANAGQLYWDGTLTTVSGEMYRVVLTYPNYYPGQEIKTYMIQPYIPELSEAQHRYSDGHLCLYSNDHGGKGQGFGPSMSVVSYVAWTAAWLHAYEIYKTTGTWPQEDI